mgnify:FL=1
MTSARNHLEPLLTLYRSPAAQRLYDEAVTELDHALQCAALARSHDAPPTLVAAALLHDVGHLVLDDNVSLDEQLTADAGHDRAGADHLARWFGPAVTEPVALHVEAKRYLCAVDAGYHGRLSPASVRSLTLQGGRMSPAECADFEARPHHEAAVALRRWDDAAKTAGLDVDPFDTYTDLLVSLLADVVDSTDDTAHDTTGDRNNTEPE